MPDKRFDSLMLFLKEQESIYEQLEQLREEDPGRRDAKVEPKHARTRSAKTADEYPGCIVCV